MKRAEALLLTALVASAGRLPAEAAQKITITTPSVDAHQGAFLIAERKGYYAAEGLDVEFIYAGGGVATPGLLSGTIDGSASGAAALSAILRGGALRIVLVFENTPPYEVWAAPNIHTLDDLKGKAVGIATRGDTFEIAMRLALLAAGIPADAVTYAPLGTGGTAPAALVSGVVPAVVIAPAEVVRFQDNGLFKKFHMLADLSGKVHMPFAGFAMAEKLLYGDPVLAKKIIRATVKGSRYEKLFKNETVAIVATFQQKAATDTHASEVEYDYFVKAATRDLTLANDQIAADLAVRADLIGLAKDQIPPIDKIYDFSIARAVNAELDASRWKPAR